MCAGCDTKAFTQDECCKDICTSVMNLGANVCNETMCWLSSYDWTSKSYYVEHCCCCCIVKDTNVISVSSEKSTITKQPESNAPQEDGIYYLIKPKGEDVDITDADVDANTNC